MQLREYFIINIGCSNLTLHYEVRYTETHKRIFLKRRGKQVSPILL